MLQESNNESKEFDKKIYFGELIHKYKYFALIALFVIIAELLPYLMDYYVLQDEASFWIFFSVHSGGTYYFYESVMIMGMMLLIWGVTQSACAGGSITAILMSVLSFASRLKYLSRNELLTVADLRLTEAAGMAINFIRVDWNVILIKSLGFVALFIILSVLVDMMFGKYKTRFVPLKRYLIIAAVSLCIIPGLIVYTNMVMAEQTKINSMENSTVDLKSYRSFTLFRFLQNDSVGFSSDAAEKYYKELLNQAEDAGYVANTKVNKPNVIVIMNESWWDPSVLRCDDLEFSVDPMDSLRECAQENDITIGNLSTNVYGGGTVSSEFEFTVGLNSKYFCSSGGAYTVIKGRDVSSIATYFNSLDYDTIAIHPYYGSFYSRDVMYPQLGFDKSVFDEDMKYKDYYSMFISDDSLADQIIYESEQTTNPYFIWSVSMANHLWEIDYHREPDLNYPYEIDITDRTGTIDENDMRILKNYINGIYQANESFIKLVEHYKNVEEPTVIMMYGDHCYDLPESVLNIAELDTESTEQDQMKTLYRVPVVFWKNYETDRDEPFTAPDGQEICTLDAFLVDYASLADCPMTVLQRYKNSVVMADTRFYVLKPDGDLCMNLSENDTFTLLKYKSIQYSIMLGDDTMPQIWDPIIK